MPFETSRDLEGYREYLRALAWKWLPIDLRAWIDVSELVQATLRSAEGASGDASSKSLAEEAGWLRGLLAERLNSRLAGRKRAETVSIAELERSSARLARLFPRYQSADGSEERAIAVANLLANHPADQFEALMLQHCEDWPVEAISRHMDRSPREVGGLLRRGLRSVLEQADSTAASGSRGVIQR